MTSNDTRSAAPQAQRNYSDARRDIFDDPEADMRDVLRAAIQQPAQAWRLMHSPSFLMGTLMGECINLLGEFGEVGMLNLLPGFEGLPAGEIHRALESAEIVGASRMAPLLPEPDAGVYVVTAQAGRARNPQELASVLGRLYGSGHWREELWNVARTSVDQHGKPSDAEEMLEVIDALQGVSKQSAEQLRQQIETGGVQAEETIFLATSTHDITLISALTTRSELCAIVCSNPGVPTSVLAMIATFGTTDVRMAASQAVKARGEDPVQCIRELLAAAGRTPAGDVAQDTAAQDTAAQDTAAQDTAEQPTEASGTWQKQRQSSRTVDLSSLL